LLAAFFPSLFPHPFHAISALFHFGLGVFVCFVSTRNYFVMKFLKCNKEEESNGKWVVDHRLMDVSLALSVSFGIICRDLLVFPFHLQL
jgi:hypothetical protein